MTLPHHTPRTATPGWTWAILAIWLGYACLRYRILGPGLGKPAPVWLLNKALAASAAQVLGLALWASRPGGPLPNPWWRPFTDLAFLHVLLSLALLSSTHYPRLVQAGGLWTGAGNLVITAGAGCALAFLRAARDPGGWMPPVALALLLIHLAALGLPGWFHPGAWPGALPPISLLCCLPAAAALAWSLGRRPR